MVPCVFFLLPECCTRAREAEVFSFLLFFAFVFFWGGAEKALKCTLVSGNQSAGEKD